MQIRAFRTYGVQWNCRGIGERMARNSAKQDREVSELLSEKRDSQSIAALIEQLERDLKQTRKEATQES